MACPSSVRTFRTPMDSSCIHATRINEPVVAMRVPWHKERTAPCVGHWKLNRAAWGRLLPVADSRCRPSDAYPTDRRLMRWLQFRAASSRCIWWRPGLIS